MKAVRRVTEPITFIPAEDRSLPPEQHTVITLRPMTQPEKLAALDDVRRNREWTSALETCAKHITRIDNFPSGNPRPWPAKGAADEKREYLTQFDEGVIYAISDYLFAKSSAPDDAGNS